MTTSSLAKKLLIKSGHRMIILNPPTGYLDELGPLPEGVELAQEPTGSFDFVHLFAGNSEELGRYALTAISAVKPEGLLWISYPKRSSEVETDLTRDAGWEGIYQVGLRAVAQVSINDVWSALRFRPSGSDQELLDAQYSGPKAALRPIYDRIVGVMRGLGDDVHIAPRKTYVALIRGKQFGVIKASTNTRVDLGLKLSGKAANDRLVDAGGFGSGSITHRVILTAPEQVDDALIGWIREAYAGVI
jgi:hypothetical protein